MLKGLSVKKKIVGGFGFVLALLIVTSWTGTTNLSRATEGFQSFGAMARVVGHAANLQSNLISQDKSFKEYLIYKDSKSADTYHQRAEKSKESLAATKAVVSDPELLAAVATVDSLLSEYESTAESIATNVSMEVEVLGSTVSPKGAQAEKSVKQLFDKLSLDNNLTGMVNAAGATRKYLLGRYYFGQFLMFFRTEDRDRAKQEFTELEQIMKTLEGQLTEPAQVSRLKAFLSAFADYRSGTEKLETAVTARNGLVVDKLNTLGPQLLDSIESLKQVVANKQSAMEDNLLKSSLDAKSVMLGVAGFGLLFGIILALTLVRSICLPINRALESLKSNTLRVFDSVSQIASSSQSLAQGTTQQAASLSNAKSSVEEISKLTGNSVSMVGDSKRIATEARHTAVRGVEQMQAMNSAMQAIQTASSEVSNIIKIIDEIAFQTNLLALNAAVEAARAGDAGRGFAVVAEEVRSLAQRSTQAAKETEAKIASCVKSSAEGARQSNEVEKLLKEITQKVEAVDGLLSRVSKASEEQNKGIEGVNQIFTEIGQVTQMHAAGAEEGAAAAEELRVLAEQLKRVASEVEATVKGHSENGIFDLSQEQNYNKPNPAPSAQRVEGGENELTLH